MDGIKIRPRNENCEILGGSSLLEVIFGWSRPTTVKTCLYVLPKSFFDDVWVNKIHKWVCTWRTSRVRHGFVECIRVSQVRIFRSRCYLWG